MSVVCILLLNRCLGESKAHVHIVQTAILANRLNRTLVLPNVVRSDLLLGRLLCSLSLQRSGLMRSCFPHAFSF